MLIEETGISESLRNIVGRLRTDAALREDLMQECLIRLWRLEIEKPGRTRSWYLQNCRFHLQHWLSAGRSLDSLKRMDQDKRIIIDGVNDELAEDGYHTNGELIELVSARDIAATLARHLKPAEIGVLAGLVDGLVLRDIALRLSLSYPTALKYRRKIAALAIRLGITPPTDRRRSIRRGRRADRATRTSANSIRNRSGLAKPAKLPGNGSRDSRQIREEQSPR